MLDQMQSLDLSAIEDFLAENALVLTCAAIGISGLITALAALLSAARTRTRETHGEFAELKGRISVMTELSVQQNAEQVRSLNDRIDTLARQVSQSLDATAARLGENLNQTAVRLGDNLSATAARLGNNMSEAERRTSDSLSNLNERLSEVRRSASLRPTAASPS